MGVVAGIQQLVNKVKFEKIRYFNEIQRFRGVHVFVAVLYRDS
jgi:hypothetical protein